jgi:hypothetical protein
MLAHTKGHEGSLLTKARIRSFRMLGPLDGVPDVSAARYPWCQLMGDLGTQTRTLELGTRMINTKADSLSQGKGRLKLRQPIQCDDMG